MPISFPSNPTTGQTYTYNNRTWIYNGSTWDTNSTTSVASAVAPITYNASTQTVGLDRTILPTTTSTTALTLKANPLQTANLQEWQNNSGAVLGSVDANGNSAFQNANYAGKNALINGGFDIWQRGASFAVTGATVYTADRWAYGSGATVSATVSRQTASTITSNFGLRFGRNSGQTTGTLHRLIQPLESFLSRQFIGKTVTLSFSAFRGANAPTSLVARIYTGTGTDQTAADSWAGWTGAASANLTANVGTSIATYSLTTVIPVTARQILVDFSYTSTGTAGADEWFQLENVQLEAGSVATPFFEAGGTLAGELAACQRYYVRFGGLEVYQTFGWGQADQTTNAVINVPLPVTMRVRPTSIDFANLNLSTGPTVTPVTTASLLANNCSNGIASVYTTVASGLTQYRPYWLNSNNTLSGFLGIGAEL